MRASDIITSVRALIKDNNKNLSRWNDVSMLSHLTQAMRDLIRRRPDALYIDTLPVETEIDKLTSLNDELVINDMFEEALVSYVCYRCLSRDSDDPANATQASIFLNQYMRLL